MNISATLQPDYVFLLTIGSVLISGILISALGRNTFLPRVSLLLLFGVIIGRGGLDLIPIIFSNQFEIISEIALLMVGFLLGGKLIMTQFQGGGLVRRRDFFLIFVK